MILDAHSSEATSGGNNPLGVAATFATIGAPVILQHSVDFRGGYPIQNFTIDDSASGNNNGILDVGDLATQVARSADATHGRLSRISAAGASAIRATSNNSHRAS